VIQPGLSSTNNSKWNICFCKFQGCFKARSKAEYYSKICIAVEECDETLYWLELLSEASLIEKEKSFSVQNEATELLKSSPQQKRNSAKNK